MNEVELGAEKTTVPALGISLVVGISGGQITFQTHVPVDLDVGETNVIIDKMNTLADRLRAKTELPDLRDELFKIENEFAQLNEDVAAIEGRYEKAQASLEVQIQTLSEEKAKVLTAAQEAHAMTGRAGDYSPQGKTLASMRNFENDIKKVLAEKDKNTAERDVALSQLATNRERFEKLIQRKKDHILEREAAAT